MSKQKKSLHALPEPKHSKGRNHNTNYIYLHQPKLNLPTKIIPLHNNLQKVKIKKLSTQSEVQNNNVSQHRRDNSTRNNTPMKHKKKSTYNQHDPSLSSSLQCPLSGSIPKQSPTPQQTCIYPPIVYTTYSVDSRKIPRSTNISKTLSEFYSRTPHSSVQCLLFSFAWNRNIKS